MHVCVVRVNPDSNIHHRCCQVKPGRDRINQSIENTQTKSKEYDRSHFNSPLTDYLPASPNVPTPKAVPRRRRRRPGNFPMRKIMYKYMRMLEKATPRIGDLPLAQLEGREMIAVQLPLRNYRQVDEIAPINCSPSAYHQHG